MNPIANAMLYTIQVPESNSKGSATQDKEKVRDFVFFSARERIHEKKEKK
jgi:hypothetical protein